MAAGHRVVHDDGYMSMYASEWGLIVALPSTVGPANVVCPGVICVPLSESLYVPDGGDLYHTIKPDAGGADLGVG
jgi:hypothetical protein